jgi:hypothetical protein
MAFKSLREEPTHSRLLIRCFMIGLYPYGYQHQGEDISSTNLQTFLLCRVRHFRRKACRAGFDGDDATEEQVQGAGGLFGEVDNAFFCGVCACGR